MEGIYTSTSTSTRSCIKNITQATRYRDCRIIEIKIKKEYLKIID